MERYHERRARRKGQLRECRNPGCKTVLSRYNDSKTCNKCRAKERADIQVELLEMFSVVG